MSGLHDKRMVRQSPSVTRPRPTKRAEESSRRSNRIKESALPRKRDVSATSTARSKRIKESALPRPADANPDDDVSSVYVLRNRQVVVPKSREPVVPKSSEPVVPESTLVYVRNFREGESGFTSQTLSCAKLGLEYYNRMNQGDEHELVEALYSNAFTYDDIWVHVSFRANHKGGTSCPMFFAEVKNDYGGYSCVSCFKMGPGLPTKSGCGVCPPLIVHPADWEC